MNKYRITYAGVTGKPIEVEFKLKKIKKGRFPLW